MIPTPGRMYQVRLTAKHKYRELDALCVSQSRYSPARFAYLAQEWSALVGEEVLVYYEADVHYKRVMEECRARDARTKAEIEKRIADDGARKPRVESCLRLRAFLATINILDEEDFKHYGRGRIDESGPEASMMLKIDGDSAELLMQWIRGINQLPEPPEEKTT